MAAKRATTKRPSTGATLSISGLSAEARNAISKAARKRRRSINAWAAEALEDAARRTLAGGADDEILAQLRGISRKLDQLAERPRPMEKTLDQVQKSIHELGSQLGGIYADVRERGGETMEEVRARTGTVVGEMSGKASQTLSQWRSAADKAMDSLQRNLDELRAAVFRAEGPERTREQPAAAPAEPPTRTPAQARRAAEGAPLGTRQAKPPSAGGRAKPKSKSGGGP